MTHSEMALTGAKFETALSVRQLCADYGDVRALEEISIDVGESEVVAILGANGAGKTSLLRAISGVLAAQSGEIWFRGQKISGLRPDEVARRGLGHVPESRCIFPGLSVKENLLLGLFGSHHGGSSLRQKLEDHEAFHTVMELFPWLANRMKQNGDRLSGGEQQMLAISRALLSRPSMLLLDEPSLGLSPRMAGMVFEALGRVHETGVPMIVVGQSTHLTLKFASRGYVMNRGRVVAHGSAEELLHSSSLDSAYFS